MPVGVGRTLSAAVTDPDCSLGCAEVMTQEDLEGVLLAFYDVRQERKGELESARDLCILGIEMC